MNRCTNGNRYEKSPNHSGQATLILAVGFFLLLTLHGYGQQTNAVITEKESLTTTNKETRASDPAEIRTLDGTAYKSVRVLKVEPDGLLVEYAPHGGGVGLAKLKFENLPADSQQKHGYDAEKAAAYRMEQAEGQRQWIAAMQVQETRARAAVKAREEDNFKGILEREKLDNDRRNTEAARVQAEASRKQSDAAMLKAMTPAPQPQVNVQVNQFTPAATPYFRTYFYSPPTPYYPGYYY